MISQIDVSGYDMAETLAKDRRRRSEAELSQGMSELDAMLLPLALAVARLSARTQVTGGAQ
ncbi:MAG: hypothetical protein V7672_14640 [Brevundimonas sp.]|jgi:hypothetical protein|uniref:hypothetical protein n=1 Tax=Brevundimonas sp. TaxID=1871086 RepID=UPI00300219D6